MNAERTYELWLLMVRIFVETPLVAAIFFLALAVMVAVSIAYPDRLYAWDDDDHN
jgi:hypothetical protein